MKPTVGRIVHFKPRPGVTHAAIITFVHSDTCVNLAVFDSNGGSDGKTSVQLVAPGQPKPEFGFFCEWMPYQVEKAHGAHSRAFSVATLTVLIEQWENRARSKFKSGEAQPDEASRRFVEHGATCYFNCAQELRAALASALPPSSATPP